MENASKALTMAGGMLIAIAVVGLLIFGFQQLRSFQNTQDKATNVGQIADFNNELEAYNKQAIPGHQMLSLANYVVDLNLRAEDEGYDKIQIIVDMNFENPNGTFGLYKQRDFDDFVNFVANKYENLSDYGDEGSKKAFKELYFKCNKVETNNTNGRINKMEFMKINRK
ncbi:MAG: hypothetical protein IKG14_03210 [Clostridia bacterium]|nr:hypothetical protein [Clostridia bacterium]